MFEPVLVSLAGFEPATSGLATQCSIQIELQRENLEPPYGLEPHWQPSKGRYQIHWWGQYWQER